MSTIEDFKNALISATATRGDGSRAMKMGDVERRWIFPSGRHMDDEEMAEEGYTLDQSAPTTAREALDLAWDLAYKVTLGQVIPKGTHYLEIHSSGVREYTAMRDLTVSPGLVPITRTFEPLPDPKPDWIDAPAVLARTDNDQFLRVWSAHKGDLWASTSHTYTRRWQNLRDVTPLYPKEGQES